MTTYKQCIIIGLSLPWCSIIGGLTLATSIYLAYKKFDRIKQCLSDVPNLGWKLIAGSLIAIILIITGYCTFDLSDNLLVGFLGSTISTVFIAIIAFFISRSGISFDEALEQSEAARMMTVDPAHDDVDWGRIIDRSKELDIVVAYYDKWANRYEKPITELFRRGGRIRILMPDPGKTELMNTLSATFFPSHPAENIRKHILDTATILERLKKEAASPSARLEVLHLPRIPLYSMVLADDFRLYLSTFEQFRDKGVRASVFYLKLRRSTQLGDYWLGRRDLFLEIASQPKTAGEAVG